MYPELNMHHRNNLVSPFSLPPIIFGTSGLGNLFEAQEEGVKRAIIKELFMRSAGVVVFDTAGKYGAGLALEVLGRCLKELNIPASRVIISNKLGWFRTPLQQAEPTFEPGVWKKLKHDAVQKISYNGILECFEQGNQLLDTYSAQMVSVHDPDEYLASAMDEKKANLLYLDILDAYRALHELKKAGKVQSIGVGAKDWRSIQRIANDVQLDWVMIANSLTIKNHPKELLDFINGLKERGIDVINSAVFHSGFLIGGDYYNYKLVQRSNPADRQLFIWRDIFFTICNRFRIKPAEACAQFSFNVPGVCSIALSATNVERVMENLTILSRKIPIQFWNEMEKEGLIQRGNAPPEIMSLSD